MGRQWTLDDIAWQAFDPQKVDPDVLLAVKAASMVESHSDDYVVYLCHVFHDDPEFQKDVERWGREELQHGSALRRWAEIADPNWDFAAAFARFKKGHVLPLDATESIRGSRTSELVARCVVEVGTSSFYSALRDAVDEPVLKQICGNIAADEFRHYKLFYKNSKHYRGLEKSSLLARLWVALSRLWESDDDELAYAFYCGSGDDRPYDRETYYRAYAGRAYCHYRFGHVAHAVNMVLKAIGISPQSRFANATVRLGWRLFQFRARQFQAAVA